MGVMGRMAALAALMSVAPATALATEAADMASAASAMLDILQKGTLTLGGFLFVLGAVLLGASLAEGGTGGGNKSGPIMTMIAGAVIVAAAALWSYVSFSFA